MCMGKGPALDSGRWGSFGRMVYLELPKNIYQRFKLCSIGIGLFAPMEASLTSPSPSDYVMTWEHYRWESLKRDFPVQIGLFTLEAERLHVPHYLTFSHGQ